MPDRMQIAEGTPVWSRDGRELGQVAEVRADEFRVGVRMKLDYWLPLELIGEARPDRVTLRIAAAEIDQQRTPAPERESKDDGFLFAAPSAGLSTDERADDAYLDFERHRMR